MLNVIRDGNGNHVVQKIVEVVPRCHLDFIMDAVRGQVSALSAHSYGCRVIQRLLEYGTAEDKAVIMRELHAASHLLITDQYGNYVAQHVIKSGKADDSSKIIELVISDFLTLSKHKYASNVVEQCIERGTPAQRTSILKQLTGGKDGAQPLQILMKDQYGNYVIRKSGSKAERILFHRLTIYADKLLNILEGEEKARYISDIKEQLSIIKKAGASRQLQSLEKALEAMLPVRKSSSAHAEAAGTASSSSANGTQSATSSPPGTSASAVSSAPAVESGVSLASKDLSAAGLQGTEAED